MRERRGLLRRFLLRIATPLGTLAGAARRAAPPAPARDAPTPDLDRLLWMLDDVIEQAGGARPIQRRDPVDVPAMLARIRTRRDPERLALPAVPWPLLVLADAAALEELFEVIIANALASGTRAVVRLDRGTSAMVAHVDDDGPGVPRSARAQLFSPRAGGGALARARQIALAHGGEITVSSSPEGGARFTVRLPLILEHEMELAAAS